MIAADVFRKVSWFSSRAIAYSVARVQALRWYLIKGGLPRSSRGTILVHIGCGEINAPGFVNVDARRYRHIHFVTKKITRLSMFPANSVELIYMSHILEHVKRDELLATLSEMRRALVRGGTLRISVPDFDYITEIYFSNNREISAIEQPLMGGQDYAFNFHYTVFNRPYLENLLHKSGFSVVRQWDPTYVENHDFEDWASRNVEIGGKVYPISLNVEAVK